VSQLREDKIAAEWFEIPQPTGFPLPRPTTWRHRVPEILVALRTLDHADLERGQIDSLFGLQRRAALRLMAPYVSGNRHGVWQVDRQRLIRWLETLEQEVAEEQKRHQQVLQSLHDAEEEIRSLREELRARGRPDPPSWTLKQEVFCRNILSLPKEIAISPGMVSVSFPVEEPIRGAQLLHELSLAMVNDWTSFCRLAAVPGMSDEDVLDRLLDDLEQQKQRAI
jgi:hypothetical protein